MGSCMTKESSQRVDSTGKQTPVEGAGGKRDLQLKGSHRHSSYIERKYISVCGSLEEPVTLKHMSQFFSFLGLETETLRILYGLWRKKQAALTYSNFKKGYFSIISQNQSSICKIIYQLFFYTLINPHEQVGRFNKEFGYFIKGVGSLISSSGIRQSSRIQNTQTKLKLLEGVLESRRSVESWRQVQKWLRENIDFLKFKQYFLEGAIQRDERVAFQMFAADAQGIQHLGKAAFLNVRWCKKLVLYITNKFKPEEGSSMGLSNFLSQGDTPFKSQIHKHIAETPRRDSSTIIKRKKSLSVNPCPKLKAADIIQFNFQDYPGEIDNISLVGNFYWELRRNLRSFDYVIVRPETYKALQLCFGGGPYFERSFASHYIETKVYFVQAQMFTFDKGRSYLIQKQLLQFGPNETVKNVLSNFSGKEACYHRNVGGPWVPIAQLLKEEESVGEFFGQTSFLVYMQAQDEKKFLGEYTSPDKVPVLGDIYEKVNSINSSAGDNQMKVCVIGTRWLESARMVSYIVLGQGSHNTYNQRQVKMKEFAEGFKAQKHVMATTFMPKKNRAGISNLGNTCYLNASLQALFSFPGFAQLLNTEKKFGKELAEILKSVEKRKKSVFPIGFKDAFDDKFPAFQGQEQEDAHQFLISLLSILREQNEKVFRPCLQSEIKSVNSCNCGNLSEVKEVTPIITLPLKDFDKKEVKIDYIIENTKIQTIAFEIPQQCTIKEWQQIFKKNSRAKNIYMCLIENSDVEQTYSLDELSPNDKYHSLNIESHFLITAYEIYSFESKQKLSPDKKFRMYKNPDDGNFYIACISAASYRESFYKNDHFFKEKQNKEIVQSQSQSREKDYSAIYEDVFEINFKKMDSVTFTALAKEEELLGYPEYASQREIIVKVINFDSHYNEKIGHPLILKLLASYPIAAVQDAVQLALRSKDYDMRLAPKGRPSECIFCGYRNCYSKRCFERNANLYPIEWFEGRAEFILLWSGTQDYRRLIERVKFTPGENNIDSEIDSFEDSLKRLQGREKVTLECDKCRKRNALLDHQDIISVWPQNLILQLKRFTIKRRELKKVHTRWRLDTEISIGQKVYDLSAVILHIGVNAGYGHYLTVSDGFKYDDELVEAMEYREIPPEQIYLMFYTLRK